jgi:hypothetical protein
MLSAALGPNADDSAPAGLNAKAGIDIVAMIPVATVMTATLRAQPPFRFFAAGLDCSVAAATEVDGGVWRFGARGAEEGAFMVRSDRRETRSGAVDRVDEVEGVMSGS